MENIIEPNDTFDFTKLSLAHPVGIQGGAYFTKIEHSGKPLYIQTSKSQTKQGIIKTGKKYYCDLMFDKNAAQFISWIEALEERCQQLIFDRRDTWFENNLEAADIESAFGSTIRVYKSGKYYLVRTNVKSHNSLPFIKIYSEHETTMSVNDITEGTNIISILEIQGIKFTARNFQIEIELKQVMVLDDDPLFENCLINPKTHNGDIIKPLIHESKPLEKNEEFKELDEVEDEVEDNVNKEQNIPIVNTNTFDLEETQNGISLEELMSEPEIQENSDNISLDLEFEKLDENIEENTDDLKEMNELELNLDDDLEIIHLKKPNQVYFELYKEARNKAKIAKKNALIAYLEAKNIKKTYMLDDLTDSDSDSDIDAEIDDASESELEGL